MSAMINHPDFWRYVVGIAVVIFALSLAVQAIDTFVTRPRTALRQADRTAHKLADRIVREMRNRGTSFGALTANNLAVDTILGTRMKTPRDVAGMGPAPVQEPAQGPQERPEPTPATDEAEDGPEPVTEPFKPVPEMPRFGQPVSHIYRREDYEEPLRCSIESGVCGGRELVELEGFYEIPDLFNPEGPFVVVCTEDATGAVGRTMIEPDLRRA